MLCPRLKKLKCALVVSAAFCVLIGPYQWLKGSTIDDRIYYDEPVKLHFGDKKDSTWHLTDPLLNQELQSFKCARLFQNDSVEMAKAATFLSNLNYSFSRRQDEEFLELTSNCDQFKKDWGFFVYPPSQEETSFPIAFSILFHENVEQLTRLLRAIYRPQNQYCIHIDGKSPGSIIEIVTRISSCFPNVFIASKLEIVIYASATRLTADINCMKDLVQNGEDWKYLLNLAASEFPIMSNLQIVQILQEFNGSNDIYETFSTMDRGRFKKRYYTYIDLRNKSGYIIHSNDHKDPPPHGLKITKGNAYNVFSRKFVEWALKDRIARDLLAWVQDTLTPDEHYWATLNNLFSNPSLKTPGGYKGHPDNRPSFGRYIGWSSPVHKDRCKAGRYIHNICTFGVLDLPVLWKRNEIIANKFDIQYDPIAYKCMEELILNNSVEKRGVSRRPLYRRIAQLGV